MRLLIATGGSPHSKTALQLAVHILREQQRPLAEPTVLTVIERQDDMPKAKAILAQAVEFLSPHTAEVRTRVRLGRRSDEIIGEAKEGGYDLIILGKRPAHRLLTRFLGSTVTRVMEQAPCPVMIAQGKPAPIRRILLCDSGAQSPSLLSRFLETLVGVWADTAEVTILHVMSQISAGLGAEERQLQEDAADLIRQHAPEGELLVQDLQALKQANVWAYPKVRHGLVVDEILAEARSGDYDLVVIGTNRWEGKGRFLLANLARQIIAQIDRPVLVIK